MSIRDEELIEYLLGEADEALTKRIQLALQTNAQVSIRLEELRAALGLLDSLKGAIEPPAGLAERTLDFIDQQDPEEVTHKVRLHPSASFYAEGRSPRRIWESAVVTVALAACACLMLPLVVDARSLSRELRVVQT